MEVPQYIPALLMQFYAIWLDSIAFGICIAIPLVKNGCLVVLLSGCFVVLLFCCFVVWKTVPSEARVTRDEVSGL